MNSTDDPITDSYHNGNKPTINQEQHSAASNCRNRYPLSIRNHSNTRSEDLPVSQLFQTTLTSEAIELTPQKDSSTKEPLYSFNALSAHLVEFVSRILLERRLFQNNSIPQELLLSLANDLIHTLAPQKKETLNVAKECTLLWKQVLGQTLTQKEKDYQDALKEIDVFGEILNGLRYSSMAIMGERLYSSVTSALQIGLSEHIPSILAYSGVMFLGPRGICCAVDKVLQYSGLTEEQKIVAQPWLNVVGRLAVGFLPKVHANEGGVYYHYPSTEGHTQTFSRGQATTLYGDSLSIQREGELETPEGTFEGTYSAEFRLHEVYELTEESVRIRVLNSEGKIVFINFKKVHGPYGPEIQVGSEDKKLEQHWREYFVPKKSKALPKDKIDSREQRDLDRLDIALSCKAGLAIATLGSLATNNLLPIALGSLSCVAPAMATSSTSPVEFPHKIKKLIDTQNLWRALDECDTLIAENDASEAYYYKGIVLKKLGDFVGAFSSFRRAAELGYEAAKEEETKLNGFINDRGNISFRNNFLKEMEILVPKDYEYIAMSALAYYDKELADFQNEKIERNVNVPEDFLKHWKKLQSNGWELGPSNAKFDTVGNSYFGIAFVHSKMKCVIVAHRRSDLTDVEIIESQLQVNQTQYEQAHLYVGKIAEKYEDYTLSHTGHSSGAMLAEFLAHNRNEVAVTADSPGIKELVANNNVEHNHIVTYLSAPDVINTYGIHLGELRAIATNVPKLGTQNIFADFLERLGFSGNPIYPLEKDLPSHKISEILSIFDENIGYAKEYRLIKKWPQGRDERIFFGEICQKNGLSEANPDLSNPHLNSALEHIYKTEMPSHSRMPLSLFSVSVQQMIKAHYYDGKYYANINPNVLALYDFEEGDIVLKSNQEIFTVNDFKSYLEYKISEAHRKDTPMVVPKESDLHYRCCEEDKLATSDQNQNRWIEYDLFFNLPSIQGLNKSDQEFLQKILKQEEEDKAGFKRHLKVLGKNLEQDINEELKNGKHETEDGRQINFRGLIDELFNTKPDVEVSFLSSINRARDFFVGKTLQIKNSYNLAVLFGEIVDYKRICRSIYFTLKDQSSATIDLESGCHVKEAKIKVYVQRSLLTHIRQGDNTDSEFTIRLAKDGRPPDWVKEGRYKIKDNKIVGRQQVTHLFEVTTNLCYEIEINEDEQGAIKNATIRQILLEGKGQKFDIPQHRLHKLLFVDGFDERSIKIDHLAVNEAIQIKKYTSNQKMDRVREIRKLQEDLVIELRKEENYLYLDNCLTHLVSQKFGNSSDPSLFKGTGSLSQMNDQLKKICTLYADIKEPMDIEKLHLGLLLEANYQRLVDKKDSLSVSEGMELFTEAYKYIKEVEGKNLILFLGMTGSGKSTAINFLLGRDLKEITNQWGQSVWEVENQEGDFPKIGHSISTSETIYTKGYQVNEDPGLMLCDTPGRGDTRGENYELSASLSIDQTIRNAASISAVVVTVPLEFFLLDRGNPIVNFMDEIRQLIPSIYSSKGKGLYLLVTKHGEYTEKQFDFLLQEHCEKTGILDNTAGKREMAWELVCSMRAKGKMSLVQVPNSQRADKLLEQYRNSEEKLYAADFAALMQTDSMRNAFAEKCQLAAHTWTHQIINRYLFTIPGQIKDCENKIIDDTDKKQTENQTIENNKKLIKNLENLLHLNSSGDYNREQAIEECSKNTEEYLNSVNKSEQKTTELKSKIQRLTCSIEEVNIKIERLSTGNETKALWDYYPNPKDRIQYCTLKTGVWEKARLEFRSTNANDCVNGAYDQDTLAESYTGPFVHDAMIDKEYWIAPRDKAMKQEFQKHGLATDGSLTYKAEIKGEYYELDMDRRIHQDSKKMLYYFKTSWLAGRDLPWIEITHVLPKVDIYAADLTNLYAKKTELEKELMYVEENLNSSQKEEENWKNKIVIENLFCNYIKEEENINLNKLIELLNKKNEKSEELVKEYETSINKEMVRKKELNKEKRNLAIVIKTRWKTAEALDAFSDLVISREADRIEDKKETMRKESDLINTCKEYKETYHSNKEALLTSCQEDLSVD